MTCAPCRLQCRTPASQTPGTASLSLTVKDFLHTGYKIVGIAVAEFQYQVCVEIIDNVLVQFVSFKIRRVSAADWPFSCSLGSSNWRHIPITRAYIWWDRVDSSWKKSRHWYKCSNFYRRGWVQCPEVTVFNILCTSLLYLNWCKLTQ